MPKYRVIIEFDTEKPLKFPHDAQLLDTMQVQLESLEDGDITDEHAVTVHPGKIEVL